MPCIPTVLSFEHAPVPKHMAKNFLKYLIMIIQVMLPIDVPTCITFNVKPRYLEMSALETF